MFGRKSDPICPLVKGPCLEHGCKWYIRLIGSHPQTGNPVDEFGCAISWLPVLLIESSQQTRQAGAAIESFRNEMIKANDATTKLLVSDRTRRLNVDRAED